MRINRIFKALFALCLLCSAQSIKAEPSRSTPIAWLTNYEQALSTAKSQSKPVLLFFTGSDWCGWCNKIENEVFETAAFTDETANKLIFVKLDFPMKSPLDPATTKQNEGLKTKYSIRSFPTVILIDSDENRMGEAGYRAGGGKQYAQHLLKIISEHAAYKQQMHRLSSHTLNGKELKRLYQKAHELGNHEDANMLIGLGIVSNQSHFFLIEKYRLLVREGGVNTEEANTLKEHLFTTFEGNKAMAHYQVALIDFEALCETIDKEACSADSAVRPLVDYMNRYGAEDKETLWRLNMEISQVYMDQQNLTMALKYAKDSLHTAPPSIQPELSITVKNIETQLAN